MAKSMDINDTKTSRDGFASQKQSQATPLDIVSEYSFNGEVEEEDGYELQLKVIITRFHRKDFTVRAHLQSILQTIFALDSKFVLHRWKDTEPAPGINQAHNLPNNDDLLKYISSIDTRELKNTKTREYSGSFGFCLFSPMSYKELSEQLQPFLSKRPTWRVFLDRFGVYVTPIGHIMLLDPMATTQEGIVGAVRSRHVQETVNGRFKELPNFQLLPRTVSVLYRQQRYSTVALCALCAPQH
jgi:hypothetical protein